MHSRVAACVIDEHLAVIIAYPSIGECHVHHITYVFLALRHKEVTTWLCYYLGGVFKRCHIHIKDIAQSGSTPANAMCQMQPSTVCFDRMRTFSVFHFHDGMIVSGIDDGLFFHFGMLDVVNESPADATARTSIYESVLRTCIEGILAIHKLRMEHHIALLRTGLEIWQAIPCLEVLCACYACCGSGCREVSGLRVVMTLCTKHTIYPSVLVLGEAHVIDIGGWYHILGHGDGLIPEAEIVDTIGRLSYCKK